MEPDRNPFAPGAGAQPPELTGRGVVLNRASIILRRIAGGYHDRSCLLIGLRGVGKTVLLNRIQGAAHDIGYIAVLLEAPEDRRLADLLAPALRRILLRLDQVQGLKHKLHEAMGVLRAFASTFKVTIGDIGVGIESPRGLADSGALDSDVTDLLVAVGEAAAEGHISVGLLIDELQYVAEEELAALLAGLHRVAQLSLPLVVFGAGLPQLVGLTGKAKSYAERLFEFTTIGPLAPVDARAAVHDPIERQGVVITDDALDEIVRVTEGYPYFLQEWGARTWLSAPVSPITLEDVRRATADATAALDQGFFRVRFDRLTPAEKDYLRAMAELGPGPHRSGDIAEMLGRTVDQVAPTRANVIAKGMAFAPAYGDTAFTVPMFDAFMHRVMPEFVPRPPRRRVSHRRTSKKP